MKNPCTPGCPERSSVCHAVCEKYDAYAKECEAKRQARAEAKKNRYYSEGAKRNEAKNLKKGIRNV